MISETKGMYLRICLVKIGLNNVQEVKLVFKWGPPNKDRIIHELKLTGVFLEV